MGISFKENDDNTHIHTLQKYYCGVSQNISTQITAANELFAFSYHAVVVAA